MIEFLTNLLFGSQDVNMAIAPWLIPLIASAAGTGLGFLQRGPSMPRIDMGPAIKAARLASNMPSGSTIMQQGRRNLTAQMGAMRSGISQMGRDVNLTPEMMRTITMRAQPQMMSTYVQGLGRVYGQALSAERGRAQAVASAAQIGQQGQMYNIQAEAQEQAMAPNPLAWGAMFGQLGGQIAGSIYQQRLLELLLGGGEV